MLDFFVKKILIEQKYFLKDLVIPLLNNFSKDKYLKKNLHAYGLLVFE